MINQIQSESELSNQYFQKCKELAFIQQPFSLKNASEEMQRRDLESEFELIRALTETKRHRAKLRSNSIIQNKKNRYPQQSIYQHSRIKLEHKNNEHQTYINANAVGISSTKRIIISQAPLESTQKDFQLMIKQEQITCVIMLCNIIESGKTRCFDYLNNRNRKIIQQIQDYATISEVDLPANQLPAWTYTHIHHSEWPDRGLPPHPDHLQKVIQSTKKFKNICIHCSAGLGRSGVLASAILLEEQAQKQQEISVFGTVRRLREKRFGAVQNSQQYRFIYQYLRWLFAQQE